VKYLVAIGAVAIGLTLGLGAHWLLGADAGYFVAKFIAAPVGLVASFLLFVVFDDLWPKKPNKE